LEDPENTLLNLIRMNTKWKVILSVMLLITAICSVFVVLVQRQHDDKVVEIIAGKSESAALLADTLLTSLSRQYQNRIKSFITPALSPSRKEIVHAFAERDSDKLLQLSKPFYTLLKKETPYFFSIAWILPNDEIFLHVHAPDKHGSNVRKMRPDIAAVNRDKRQYSGFDAGYMGMQYRVVQPVFYNDEYLGAVQFGIKASIIFDALQNKLKTIAGIAVLNEECEVVQGSKMPKFKGPTHTIRSRDVTVFQPAGEKLDWNRKQQRVVLGDRPHVILNVLPVSNFQNDILGTFFVALDISKEVAQKRTLLISVLVVSGLLLIVSFLILYFSYGALVQKILTLNQSLKNNNRVLESRVQERTVKFQESEKRLQKILDQAPLGILIANSKTMELQYANPTICTMLGYDKKELEGMGVAAMHAPADFEQVVKDFEEQAQDKKDIAIDVPFLRKDGTLFEADVISAPIELEGEACMVGFIVDRSERKKMEIQLHRAQKMEAIGMMAGGVAHDLNNILSGIVSYPELLLLKLPESSELREPLKMINESGQRAATVVADLLTVARGAASSRELYDVNTLVEEYLGTPECMELQTLYPGVECQLDLAAEQAIISCSPVHIKKALMNLTINAAEAIGTEGIIRISTCNRQIDTTQGVGNDMAPGRYVVITVQDNGPGIDDKDLEHIFEPFYTKKVMGRSGTGLGLAVVWNMVQDHKGKIVVGSNAAGTRFQLYFPVSKEVEATQAKNIKNNTPIGKNESILVVDDDRQLRLIACQILTTLNYRVESVSSGELALQFLQDNRVDLVLLDMMMEPGINGRQTYEKILAIHPGQKAIIVSGFSGSDDIKEALDLGAAEFIEKPYSIDHLGRTVKEVLRS
jgi:PAS domain S-box-containing protein